MKVPKHSEQLTKGVDENSARFGNLPNPLAQKEKVQETTTKRLSKQFYNPFRKPL